MALQHIQYGWLEILDWSHQASTTSFFLTLSNGASKNPGIIAITRIRPDHALDEDDIDSFLLCMTRSPNPSSLIGLLLSAATGVALMSVSEYTND